MAHLRNVLWTHLASWKWWNPLGYHYVNWSCHLHRDPSGRNCLTEVRTAGHVECRGNIIGCVLDAQLLCLPVQGMQEDARAPLAVSWIPAALCTEQMGKQGNEWALSPLTINSLLLYLTTQHNQHSENQDPCACWHQVFVTDFFAKRQHHRRLKTNTGVPNQEF